MSIVFVENRRIKKSEYYHKTIVIQSYNDEHTRQKLLVCSSECWATKDKMCILSRTLYYIYTKSNYWPDIFALYRHGDINPTMTNRPSSIAAIDNKADNVCSDHRLHLVTPSLVARFIPFIFPSFAFSPFPFVPSSSAAPVPITTRYLIPSTLRRYNNWRVCSGWWCDSWRWGSRTCLQRTSNISYLSVGWGVFQLKSPKIDSRSLSQSGNKR